MKKVSQLLKSLALLTLAAPIFLTANERESVGARKLECEETGLEEEQESSCFGFSSRAYQPIYFSNSVHALVSISPLGDSVEIEDGSVWSIGTYDGYRAASWLTTDAIMITQNNRWFSNYAYKIVNRETCDSIEANLYLGPIRDGAYTRYIAAIDPYRGTLQLNDNSCWEISGGDLSTFRNWAINDAMIIGYNSGWDSACEGLLINVTVNNNARAHQY